MKNVTPDVFNRELQKYGQPPIDFSQILKPGETIDDWVREFKTANQGVPLLDLTKKGIKTNDPKLSYGSSKQAIENKNVINIYESLINKTTPKIVDPADFQQALINKKLAQPPCTSCTIRHGRL
jgi:hypothetical protein